MEDGWMDDGRMRDDDGWMRDDGWRTDGGWVGGQVHGWMMDGCMHGWIDPDFAYSPSER